MGIASMPAFSKRATAALVVYMVSLLLNISWPLIFFRAHRPDIALVVIVALLISIIATMLLFSRITKLWLLLVPYALWVSYAAALNASIVKMNP